MNFFIEWDYTHFAAVQNLNADCADEADGADLLENVATAYPHPNPLPKGEGTERAGQISLPQTAKFAAFIITAQGWRPAAKKMTSG